MIGCNNLQQLFHVHVCLSIRKCFPTEDFWPVNETTAHCSQLLLIRLHLKLCLVNVSEPLQCNKVITRLLIYISVEGPYV